VIEPPSDISALRPAPDEGSGPSPVLGGGVESGGQSRPSGQPGRVEAAARDHERGDSSSVAVAGAVEGGRWAVPEATPLEPWMGGSRSAVQFACEAAVAGSDADSPPDGASPLDKLGKPRQGGGESSTVGPESFDEADRQEALETFQKRNRSKYITMGLLEDLEALDSPVPYSNARHCCDTVVQRDGKLTSSYCRCRWCLTCNRIRAGVRINRYVPVFEEWDRDGGVQFVTLTVPNCEAEALGDTLDEMLRRLKLCRKQIRRTRGLEYKGVRSIEVTYNSDAGTYHPHFHIAVCGRSTAVALRDEWLKRWPEASRAAQDVTEWDGDPGSLKELVKYPTKLMATAEGKEQPPPEALDTIFRVLKGRHLFEPVGFKLADYHDDLDPSVDLDEFDEQEAVVAAFHRPREKVLWTWDEEAHDWVDRETGQCLTEWEPTLLDRSAARTRGDP